MMKKVSSQGIRAFAVLCLAANAVGVALVPGSWRLYNQVKAAANAAAPVLVGLPATASIYNGNVQGIYASPVQAMVKLDAPADFVEARLDGGAWETVQVANGVARYIVAQDGFHRLDWRVNRQDKNAFTQRIRVDTTLPEVRFDAVSTPVSGKIILSGAASDTIGLGAVFLSADGGVTWEMHDVIFDALPGVFYFEYALDTRRMPNGWCEVLVRAVDAAGNESETVAISINVQNGGR